MAEWQPIETAPTGDRITILIYCPESGIIYQAYRFGGDDRFRMYNSGGRIIYQSPSHWMPLPDPPATKRKHADYCGLTETHEGDCAAVVTRLLGV